MGDTSYGLKRETIEKINFIFSKYDQIETVKLYGSRAKGTYRPNSDIDLSLIGNSLDTTFLFKIEKELDDLLLPYSIDLSILDQIENLALLEHIKRAGVVFYSNTEQG